MDIIMTPLAPSSSLHDHHPHYHWIQDHESVALGSFYKVDNLSDIRQILESDSNSNSESRSMT